MRKIVLIVLLTVCLVGMAYAQSNDARTKALQGTWKLVSMTNRSDGSVSLFEYKNGRGSEEYWTFDGNTIIEKLINSAFPNGHINVLTFKVVGDVLIRWGTAGEYARPYTLNGDTLIIHNIRFDLDYTYHRVK
jgi:hypothetical protein